MTTIRVRAASDDLPARLARRTTAAHKSVHDSGRDSVHDAGRESSRELDVVPMWCCVDPPGAARAD